MNSIRNSCFEKFISNITATQTEIDAIISSHTNVRQKLQKSNFNAEIRDILLVGSYSRNTNTKTNIDDGKKIDIDIAVIFKKGSYEKPQSILDKLFNFLDSFSEYKGKVKRQKRSVGIELSKTCVDVVPLQEIKENLRSPLFISKKDKQDWEITDPIGHIDYYKEINDEKPQFRNYVKALKWWKKVNKPENYKYPIGIAIEELVSKYYVKDNELFIGFLKTIESIYNNQNSLILIDPKNQENNFLSNMNEIGFQDFKLRLEQTINDIKKALDEEDISIIRKRLGNEFPECEINNEDDKERLKEQAKGNINYSSKVQ
jgi:hypothetical protein